MPSSLKISGWGGNTQGVPPPHGSKTLVIYKLQERAAKVPPATT